MLHPYHTTHLHSFLLASLPTLASLAMYNFCSSPPWPPRLPQFRHKQLKVGSQHHGVQAVVRHATEPRPHPLLEAPEGTESSRHPGHIATAEQMQNGPDAEYGRKPKIRLKAAITRAMYSLQNMQMQDMDQSQGLDRNSCHSRHIATAEQCRIGPSAGYGPKPKVGPKAAVTYAT